MDAVAPVPTTTTTTTGGPQRQRTRVGDRVTRIVFTLNNWTQTEYDFLTKDFGPRCKWMIVAKETGDSGTPHLQGACILGTRWSFSKLKTLTGFNRAHIQPMNGKPEDSLAYCTKQDSSAFVIGTLPSPGKRNDLLVVTAMIHEGKTLREIAQDRDHGSTAIVKFHRGLTVLRSLVRPARTTKPFVYWLYGATGTGKTRAAFKAGRAVSRMAGLTDGDIWFSSGDLKWFQGYDGQLVVIFDDFRPKHVSFSFLLRLLDRYPVDVEFKGGSVSFTPQFIFFTSPHDVDTTFSSRKAYIPEDIKQLHRRITEQFEFIGGDSSDDKEQRRSFVEAICETAQDLFGRRDEQAAGVGQ